MILVWLINFTFAQSLSYQLRPGVLLLTEHYLNEKTSDEEMIQQLEERNKDGWSSVERELVVDALKKRPLAHPISCNFILDEKCKIQKIKTDVWPAYLKKFDGVIIGGQFFHRSEWSQIQVPTNPQRIVFTSEEYQPLSFYADPHQISFPDLPQSKRQQMILNEAPPTLFQKHKKTLLWTVLGLVTVGAAISMSGKKVVIDSSAF
jgi:hypothetical protein